MENNSLKPSLNATSVVSPNTNASPSRCWHPVMYVPIIRSSSYDNSRNLEKCVGKVEEPPHYRVIRNIRRFFSEVGGNHQLRDRTVEDMLLALPTVSKEQDVESI